MCAEKKTTPGLGELRAEIDRIDAELLKLFAERMDVCSGVAEYKAGSGRPVYDPVRENEKLYAIAAAAPAVYAEGARRLWQTLFEVSRERQERIIAEKKLRCGLLGEHLGHSYSRPIHERLGAYSYEYYEKSPDEVEDFLKKGDWDGLNVTIPYKKTAARFCDVLSDAARATGSVNTLVRRDGKIYGYNTDVHGFTRLVQRSGVSLSGKKVLVLGSGGASRAVCFALESLGARPIVISRSGENNYGNLDRHADASAIVNATPVGMYPDNGKSPTDLGVFGKLEVVFDLIYNPSRTALLLRAEELGIPAYNGLYMLVAQAAQSSSLFTGNTLPDRLTDEITEKIERDSLNVILIGMPGCGKTTKGKIIAEKLGREFIDADEETEKLLGMPIPEFIRAHGEEAFRRAETEALANICKLSGKVIATGGGCVTRPENLPLLRQNGRVVLILRDLSELPTSGRPISQGRGVEAIFKEREPLYRAFADYTVQTEKGGSAEGAAAEIIKLLDLK